MPLQGEAKRDYMREYMRKQRAGEPTMKPPKPWKPTKRMVDQVRYWFRTGAPASHRHIIEGLDPGNEDEALRRYKAHLDERERDAPPAPKCCSFCGVPATARHTLVGRSDYPLICARCTKKSAAIFAKQRKRR